MKSLINEKKSNSPIIFDDKCFENLKGEQLSVERTQEIENLIMPKLLAEFENLKKTNPLFQKKPNS